MTRSGIVRSDWLGTFTMIINTDLLRFRKVSDTYVGVYGTQGNPYSTNYDLLDKQESEQMAESLESIAIHLTDEAARLRELAAGVSPLPNMEVRGARQNEGR